MKDIIIAIDGSSGCGKSTTAKMVAKELGYSYIDTGAMYRATTLYFLRNYVRLTNEKEVTAALKHITIEFVFNKKFECTETYLNGLRVEKEIRGMEVANKVSEVAALPIVRHAMVSQQQEMGKKRAIVMDGRDIGTTVFPDAEFKIFMSADTKIRAGRRQKELLLKGETVTLQEIIHNLEERDRIDSTREESPLRKADDAYVLDTTNLTIDSQTQYILKLVSEMA
jgi:cytidylate kinase